MWIPLWVRCLLFSLFPGEDRKLYSSASVKGCLLFSGQHGEVFMMLRGLIALPPRLTTALMRVVEIRLASEWARVEGAYGLLRPLHGEDLVYIYRQTTQRTAISPDPWEPISVLPILSAPNYVVVTERDYEAFGYRPHGLVELVFERNSHVFATCLPRWLNWTESALGTVL